MTSNDLGPTDRALQAAMEAIADTDPHLAGSVPVKWVLMVESEWPEEGHRTFSVFRQEHMPPWETLGMLRFATLQEEQRAIYGPGGEDEDDD